MRHAYVDIPLGPIDLSAGQNADLILPLTPTMLNYSVLYGSGNLGFRRPQLNMHYRSGPYRLSLGLGRNLSDDLDGDGITDGDASGLPALQCRLSMRSATTDDKSSVTMGVSGHYGRCSCPNDNTHYANWSLGFDALFELGPKLGLAGEAFWGENLRQFGGAIYQTDRLSGLHSHGGWLDLRFKAAQRWRLATGAGFEQIESGDLEGSTNARSRNTTLFFNGRYRATSDVDLGLEISRHQTHYNNRDTAMAPGPSLLAPPLDGPRRFLDRLPLKQNNRTRRHCFCRRVLRCKLWLFSGFTFPSSHFKTHIFNLIPMIPPISPV